ncbi:MAG TPA: hypothetical protein GXX31_01140 [Methanothermobacter sp.]|mgnify:CR=1 FL=1|uniref:Stage II sporulation protein M n=1 Tax=Methanothermobacter tenebrarum TaxID=680118 RepID=A0ABM7YBF3_9EURY|nr:hypothetical protein [Methanothermobacter tenebrarum]MDX9693600.1 hypothetical protein [Methanothermobacter sp.]BDH78633.1 hypothetical protein MTTB_00120 [Methanothermobacter tenebrarum]HHW15977.1 hypothetical protein [Methanothermobacter sp.]
MPQVILRFLKSFKPSNPLILVALLFYIGGFISSFFMKAFNFGFLTGDFIVYFKPHPMTWDYLRVQFIDQLGGAAFNIFISNVMVVFSCIFLGFPIVNTVLVNLIGFSGALLNALISRFGLKGLIIYLGLFHLHFEILGALLSIDAFLAFYASIYHSLKAGSARIFTREVKSGFLPLLLKILIIFLFAAFMEVFWSTWWVYVWTHKYIPWQQFYFEVYNVKFL